jgi:predicted nucleic acid-binding protein
MTTAIVVDASVVPKWFFPEPHDDFAGRLRTGYSLIAPAFVLVEVSNVLVQKLRRSEIAVQEAAEILERLGTLPMQLVEDGAHLREAMELAAEFHPSAYDCLYAAAALAHDCQVVTADREFYDNLRVRHPETMLWIEDIPVPEDP